MVVAESVVRTTSLLPPPLLPLVPCSAETDAAAPLSFEPSSPPQAVSARLRAATADAASTAGRRMDVRMWGSPCDAVGAMCNVRCAMCGCCRVRRLVCS